MKKPTLPAFTSDPYLAPYYTKIQERKAKFDALEARLSGKGSLTEFANAHEYYGLHRQATGKWVFREYAPNATEMWLVGDFSDWQRLPRYQCKRISGSDDWELVLPKTALKHGQYYHLEMNWPGGGGARLPAYVRRVVQNQETKIFAAQIWAPKPYIWKNEGFRVPERDPLIYEAHVGMAQEEAKAGSYTEFREKILPRIAKAGYNTIQLMAIMEHPYYGSFGYQVSNFYAASSRFGTPEELKALIDAAHGLGIAVIMDIVHSHAVLNEAEGIARFDGTAYAYFHDGERGHHPIWDSALFDYGRISTLHFLLSNCRFWMDEYRFDGFRFDGVTSMLYDHHGLGFDFAGYQNYFDGTVDEDALAYLALANRLIHALRPDALSIAEDVSGMPGLAGRIEDGGIGFDMRMAMGVTETWTKLMSKVSDENWGMGWLLYNLTDKRRDERTVSYLECHDQAMVGGKTAFFEMAGTDIYDAMHRGSGSLRIERAVALHKMARLATLASAGGGYLNFMGNEFGHPEWIDFPREGNGFSYEHARRQWSLTDNEGLQFSYLADWDEAMVQSLRKEPFLLDSPVKALQSDDLAKVLTFARERYFFMFNFNPGESYAEWKCCVPPGEYELVLDTDREEFGGHGRIAEKQVFTALPEMHGEQLLYFVHVYLPSRTAMILRRKKRAKGQVPSSPSPIKPKAKKRGRRAAAGAKASASKASSTKVVKKAKSGKVKATKGK